jgi:hypothetical protein
MKYVQTAGVNRMLRKTWQMKKSFVKTSVCSRSLINKLRAHALSCLGSFRDINTRDLTDPLSQNSASSYILIREASWSTNTSNFLLESQDTDIYPEVFVIILSPSEQSHKQEITLRPLNVKIWNLVCWFKTPWHVIRKRTISTERPPLVGEVSANFSW